MSNGFVHILHINLNDRWLFFSSVTLFLLCWQQKVKQILYFDKTNTHNKYAIYTKNLQTDLHYYLLLFISARLFIVLTTKCKTNLILDKTNKINSYNKTDNIFICYLSLSVV